MELVDEIQIDPVKGAKRLVAEYRDRLFCAAYRLCLNAADAEDLVFRTFRRAVDRIGTCESRERLFPWLFAILVNFYRMDLRRKMPNMLDFMPEVPEREDERPDAAATLAASEDAGRVRAALKNLPEPYREVVVFRYFEDLSVPEIATVLALPEGTVKSRLNRAKFALRQQLSGTVPPLDASTASGTNT